ncbi:hypothetical protein Hanom_Chr08g00729711 [Helianthus anomalus]
MNLCRGDSFSKTLDMKFVFFLIYSSSIQKIQAAIIRCFQDFQASPATVMLFIVFGRLKTLRWVRLHQVCFLLTRNK